MGVHLQCCKFFMIFFDLINTRFLYFQVSIIHATDLLNHGIAAERIWMGKEKVLLIKMSKALIKKISSCS